MLDPLISFQNPREVLSFFANRRLDILFRLGCAALSGCLFFLGCLKPTLWSFGWLGLVPLFIALFGFTGTSPIKQPFLYGWVTGLVTVAGGFYWMVPFLVRFSGIPTVAALPIFLLFAAYHGIVFGLFAWLICFLRRELRIPLTWIVAFGWVACEFVFPCIFPWYIAVTQTSVPLFIQVADITGPLGVSFLLALFSGAVSETGILILRKEISLRKTLHPLCACGIILATVVYGKVRMNQIDRLRSQAVKIHLGIVQPNIGMDLKFYANPKEQLTKLQESSQILAAQGADLIIWPESAYPVAFPLPMPLSRSFTEDFSATNPWRIRNGFSTPLLLGAMTQDMKGHYNTAMLLNSQGKLVGRVDKNYLLIFGEYVPYWDQLRFIKKWFRNISNTTPGTQTATFPFEYQGTQYFLGPMICYEDIIPAFGRRLFDTEHPPNLLINLTNDAWFGDTAEPHQHLSLSVFRAVEHRLDLVRATNTGVSAFIDAAGRVYDQTPVVDPHGKHPPAINAINKAAFLQAGGLYQMLGDSFAVACVAIVLIFFTIARRRSGKPIRFLMILGSTLFLHLMVFLSGTLVPNNSLASTYALLFHRNETAFSAATLFQTTTLLWPVLALSSILLGVVLELIYQRRIRLQSASPIRQNARLEIVIALLCVTVLPVALFGRMEGNTLGVVLGTLLCLGSALLGETISLRLLR